MNQETYKLLEQAVNLIQRAMLESTIVQEPKPAIDNTEVIEILTFFNEKTGRKFPAVEANLRLIRSRVKEHGAKAVRQVIALKCRQWGSDPKWKVFLRPKTVFGATNFANYVGELGV